MNKKEFIEKLKGHGAWCTECHDINGEKDRYVKVAKVRELLEQLDEPQKVKVKQFVADWFEEHKDDLEFSIWKLTIESNDNYTSDRSKMRNWIQYAPNKPYETLLSMKNGYEVEEEPKWVVKKREDSYFKSFTGIDFRSSSAAYEDYAYSFTDKSKAEAVALLVDGSVEEA